MIMPRYIASFVLAAVASAAAACGSSTPTSPSTTAATSPVTETWTGLIGPGGTASRSFSTTLAGTLTVTLTASDVPLGIGIGVPRVTNSGCRLTISQVDDPGQSVSLPADGGNYCVQVFDDGAIDKQAAFSVTIVHP